MITVAVHDLVAAARAHADVYGISSWRVADGVATGRSAHGVTFQLVRDAGAEGVRSVRLAGEPAALVALDGWSVEFGPAPEPAGAEWTFEPADPLPAEITRIWHAGVPVRDLEASTAAYSERLGVPDWNVAELRPEGATLDGEPVSNALLIARASVAGFEIELIQPTAGPTHYQLGEGVHHLLALPALTDETWPPVRDWMAARGAPVAMSGRVRGGAAEFFYLDTRRLLGGYLLEAIARRD